MSQKNSLSARTRYNLAVAKLFDQLQCRSRNWEQKAQELGTRLDQTQPLGVGLTLDDVDALVPAANISLKKIGKRHLDPGIGLPIVAWKTSSALASRRFEFAPPSGLPLNLTALLDFSTNQATWKFIYGGHTPTLKIGPRHEKIAIDWSAPAALYWRMSDLDDRDLLKVFLPTRFTDHAGLFFATPYSRKKIPIVFIHGLKSSPGTYKTMYNELVGEDWFRERYQVLFFSYPTGIAWPYNAAEFRRQLRRARDFAASKGDLSHWNQMVIVGHSMGGVISRASLVDPGKRFYEASYRTPLEELRVSQATRQAIRSTRLYQALAAPSRAIFMAAPHRGSPLADRKLVTWISAIIRLPKTLTIDLATATLEEITKAIQQGGQTRPPLTSIGTLSPTYRPYQALADSPYRAGLSYHSIIGDQGKGGGPHSSDGIVPYWSSHLHGAKSELIVPAGHSLISHPETIEEVRRILKLHLEPR